MSLSAYKQKRDFRRTPEPAGKKVAKRGWSYVVQKHAASHLHYDFRLELDGVLKSWAVPKGPSLDPAQKRLAIHVEDHPVAYGRFEGIIPEGEYGGGTVLLWDHGHWEPVGDPRAGYRQGKLKFKLHGERLQGGWMLVRRSGAQVPAEQKTWFLIKERDEAARPLDEEDILKDKSQSVVSGRDLHEIADDPDHVWGAMGSRRLARSQGKHSTKRSRKRGAGSEVVTRRKATKVGVPRKLPSRINVQLATLTNDAPTGDQWIHEIKFDGYRMLCRIDKGHVTFTSRNNQSWTNRLAHLVEAAKTLPVKQAVLDGEVVAEQSSGLTDFQALQNAFRDGNSQNLRFYVFDLLYFDGRDLRKLPLDERKELLAGLFPKSGKRGPLRYSQHVLGNGPEFFKQAAKLGLEGIICKRRDRPYLSGRSYDWLKVKCVQTEEFVIGGYTDPSGARSGFGALLLGYHNGDHQLTYAGKVGTGFSDRTLADLTRRLSSLRQAKSPFDDLRGKSGEARGAHWVKPRLVAQVAFSNWTRDRHLRHPSFQGLREDKPAGEVVHDEAIPLARAESKAKSNGQPSGATSKMMPADMQLTHPEKLLYPDDQISKLDLAQYYYEVADWILPHIIDRPLALLRCPDGRHKECFFQKHPGPGTPKVLRQVRIQEKSKAGPYVVVDDVSGLVSLVQIGTLEIHAWGSQVRKLERPDRLIFDLDPDPAVPWRRVIEAARQVRQFLQEMGLESFVKTTGGKGLHLVVPIMRRHEWDEAKEFTRQVAQAIVVADPEHFTANLSKAARTGKIFIDYLRNGRGATAVAPYSTRASSKAPVSTPVSWEELSPAIHSDTFHVSNLPQRLAALKKDPWAGISAVRQSISAAARRSLKVQ